VRSRSHVLSISITTIGHRFVGCELLPGWQEGDQRDENSLPLLHHIQHRMRNHLGLGLEYRGGGNDHSQIPYFPNCFRRMGYRVDICVDRENGLPTTEASVTSSRNAALTSAVGDDLSARCRPYSGRGSPKV
jgi:hypothetical protein